MQRRKKKNMVEILKFVFGIIIFLPIFLVAMDIVDKIDECESNVDCPKSYIINWDKNYVHKCINNRCEWIKIIRRR